MKGVFLRIVRLNLVFTFCTVAVAFAGNEQEELKPDTVLYSRTGTASYYAPKFQGRHTSNGERLNNEAYTCASYLPYDTWVRVTHLRNGKSVVVRVTDRFRPGGKYMVDLTYRAAKDIDMVRYGVARVRMEVLNPDMVRVLLPKDSITVTLPCPSNNLRIPITIPDYMILNGR